MRCYVVPLALALSAGAFGQLLPGEQLIQSGMQTLNFSSTVFLQLTGDEVFGKVDNALNYSAYFNLTLTGTRVLAQVEIVAYNNGKPFERIVGDGVTLWRYDYLNNSYSGTAYGTYSGQQPTDYSLTFFRYLSAISESYETYISTFLNQVYAANGAAYTSWMPGITPTVDISGNVNYSVGVPPRRTIIFDFNNVSGVNAGTLESISYDDVATVEKQQKRVDWTMTIVPNLAIDPAEFVFIPPLGARAVAGPHIAGAPVATSAGTSQAGQAGH